MAKRLARRPARQPSPQPQTHQAPPQIVAAQWSGPLPPPGALDQFNQIIPNGADRILTMVEEEQRARIAHDKQVLDAHIADTKRGHYLGAAITIGAVAGAVGSAWLHAHPAVSIALVSVPVVTIIRAIVSNRSNK